MAKRLMIVDDDAVSREVLCLLAEEAGFQATAAESGDAALTILAEGSPAEIILTDLRMPGTSGAALASALREVCATGTRIIAMSASGDGGGEVFDGFLRKPFAMEELSALLDGKAQVLNESTLRSLTEAMGVEQRRAMYAMCLEDAKKRVARMRQSAEADDHAAYVREAHALKGGCGLVGATELHKLAAAMEGMEENVDRDVRLRALDGFLAACGRLQRMLDAQE
ncbi:response regulator [Granulicella sp. WH15]|uniref:Hpt domain-containing response regulator n=1 Tax=Granulicella sp. WH15 TaxID=2602070 RepID=UPI0013A52D3A|nr:response regulator [Granulicella sp. WH15]